MNIDITLQGLLIGALVIAIGLAFAFWGFRVFLILLPIWGFFAGFILGANGVEYILGDGFLATGTGWVIGFLLGLLFAVLSYLYYWVAVILLGGALGYQLTIGLLQWIGFDADGILAFILALAGGAIFAVAFFLLHMPAVLVIVATAISGAGTTIAGVAIALGIVAVEDAGGGIFGLHTQWDLGWLGIIAAIALAFAGAIYQTRTVTDMTAAIREESYMNPGLQGRGPSGGAPA
jgi:hypothetical protein